MKKETKRVTYFFSYRGYDEYNTLKYGGDGTLSITQGSSWDEVRKAIIEDIESTVGDEVTVHVVTLNSIKTECLNA